ncbi:DUF4214 domain-containing protein [Paracidovorax citrulli]
MAAADYYSQIQAAYIAYYGRPADPDGLEFWAGELDKANGDLAVIIDAFGNSEESRELYGADTQAAQVNKIYQTLFGRPADMEGLQYYVNGLRNGEFSLASVALDIYNGAKNEDKAALEAKLAYAEAFTGAIDTVEELLGYSGKAAAQAARDVLETVKDEASLETALETVDEAISAVAESGNAGKTINLTAGLDTVVGTDANDVINARAFNATTGAAEGSLTAYDTIDGGKGKDTLNVFTAVGINAGLPATATVKNVETINVYGGNFGDIDAARFAGATAINQFGTAEDIKNLASTTTAGYHDLSGATGDIDIEAAATATSATIKLTNVEDSVDVHVSGDALDTLKLSGKVVDTASATPDGKVDALFVSVSLGDEVKTFTLDTTVDVDLKTMTNTDALTTLNAAASTGAIRFHGGSDITSITTGTGNDNLSLDSSLTAEVKSASLSSGAGNDEITIDVSGEAKAGNTATIDAGAGNDTIVFASIDADVTYNVNAGEGDDVVDLGSNLLKTTDVVDGGAGNDTIVLAGKDVYTNADYVVLTKQVKNFEAIEFTGSDAAGSDNGGEINAAELAAYKTITFEAGGFIKNVAADQTLVAKAGVLGAIAAGHSIDTDTGVITYGGTLNVTTTGGTLVSPTTVFAQAKDVAMTVEAGTAGAVGQLVGFAQTATVTLNNGVDNVDKPTADTSAGFITATNATFLKDLTTLTLKGTGTAKVDNGDESALVTIDASQLGGKVTVGTHAGDALLGLTYWSDNTKAETIKLGAGIDKVTLESSKVGALSAKTFDTVEGLNFVLNEDGDALELTSDTLSISTVTSQLVKFETTQTDFDLALQDAANATEGFLAFAFGGDTYVYVDAGSNGYDAGDTLVKLVGVNVDDAIVAIAPVAPVTP